MYTFTATLQIIGVNPYVTVPPDVLNAIFVVAGKNKGPIPVRGKINELTFTQTLVKYAGEWRLYVNMKMLKNSPRRIGEQLHIHIEFDTTDRSLPLHPQFAKALEQNAQAKRMFESLSPSRQHEINRYIRNLKSAEKITENIERAIAHLCGKGSFVGRKIPK